MRRAGLVFLEMVTVSSQSQSRLVKPYHFLEKTGGRWAGRGWRTREANVMGLSELVSALEKISGLNVFGPLPVSLGQANVPISRILKMKGD